MEISRSRGGSTLEQSVRIRLNAEPADIVWDSYRTDDARWIVTARHSGRLVGTWAFETVGRTVHPLDESARALMGGGPSQVADQPVATNDSAATGTGTVTDEVEPSVQTRESVEVPESDHPRARLVSVTSDPARAAEPEAESGAPEPGTWESTSEQAALLEQSEVSSSPVRAKRAKGKKGRASVPSWDEILFGASRPED